MSSALAVVSRHDMTAMEAHAAYLEEKRDLILRTVCDKDTSPAELEFFLETCKTRGLNPLAKHIYFIRRSGRPTFQTSIDGYRLIAARTGLYAGNDAYDYDTESEKNPNRATCTVYKVVGGMRCAFAASARWEEYEATKATAGSRYPTLWDSMPYQMLGKCAESAALRKAFPEELGGLYTEEEMQQADNQPREVRELPPPPPQRSAAPPPSTLPPTRNKARILEATGLKPETATVGDVVDAIAAQTVNLRRLWVLAKDYYGKDAAEEKLHIWIGSHFPDAQIDGKPSLRALTQAQVDEMVQELEEGIAEAELSAQNATPTGE